MGVVVIEVRQLQLVRALAEHGSLSGAARALGYSQPAISQQVRLLEDQLATPIVIRERRGVQLTEAGHVLLRHSSAVLHTLALAEEEVSAVAGLRAGRVRVAAFPSAAATLVAATMADMTSEHPGVTFTLTEAEPPEALELLERGQCDIAVVFRYSTDDTPSNDTLLWAPLLDEGVQVALPANHPAVSAAEVSLEDLWDSRWIAGCPDCRGHLTQACKDAGFVPDIAFETDDYVALQNLAVRGLGVALLPDLVLAAVQVGGLHIKPLTQTLARSISAVSTPGLSKVPGVRHTLKAMQRAAHEISGPASAPADFRDGRGAKPIRA
jgi:molybdate transport repressor ModE-like protein